jgi:hypothetical protein
MTAGPARAPGRAPGAGRATRLTTLALTGLILLLTAIVVTQTAVSRQVSSISLNQGIGLVLTLWVIAAVGLVVAWHQPGNPIGWLLLAVPACLLLTLASDGYVQNYRPGRHALPALGPASLIFAQLFFFPFIAFPLITWLFPDGERPRGRWGWAFWTYLALALAGTLGPVGITIAAIAGHHIHILPDGQLAQVQNPPPSVAWLFGVFLLALVAGGLSALARQAASWRRSSGERRQQLKWLMSGAAVCGISAIATFGSNSLWEILMFGIAALPVSIGVGILKYRLYDIDRIISRTLAYALVTGLLLGLYAGLVLLATQVLRFSSPVAVAGSTLAAAALFNPLRRRVQRMVDRRFNRARYDADAAVAAFAGRLASAVALDEVRADLLAVVGTALEPAHAAVWVKDGEW